MSRHLWTVLTTYPSSIQVTMPAQGSLPPYSLQYCIFIYRCHHRSMKCNTGSDTIQGLKIWSRRLFLVFLPVQNTDPSNIWTSALNSTNREWTLYWNRFLGCRHCGDSTHNFCFYMLIWPNVFDKWRSIKWLREQRNVDIIKNICMWRRQPEAIYYWIAMEHICCSCS